MTSSIDGLVSGMSTSSMISQLMQVEAAPQTKLKTKVATAQSAVTAYQSVNAKLKAAKSAAETLGRLETWRTMKATSSSTSVTATATGHVSGMAGSITFNVKSLASAQTTMLRVNPNVSSELNSSFNIKLPSYDANGVLLDPVGTTKTITLTAPSTPVNAPVPAPTPENIAAAVNAADIGIRAYVVKTKENEGVLQFVGTKTGAANTFQIEGLAVAGDNTMATTAASDARLLVNPATDPNADASYEVTSKTNTFASLMPGVSLSVSKVEDGVTVNAAADVDAIAAKFQAFVIATNDALTEIKTQTAYDPATRTGSPLTGDFTVRQMAQTLLGEVSKGLTTKLSVGEKGKIKEEAYDFAGKPSLSRFGIELSRDGQLNFDATKFKATYSEDPGKMREAGMVLGTNFRIVTNKQSDSVTDVITGRKNEIDSLNGQISNWDVRLVARREALQRQYAGLEKALGSLQNQSSWLSGQLAGLG